MDNVISLHEKNKEDFKTTLDTPLSLRLSDTKETEPTYTKPNLYRRIRWRLVKFSRLVFKVTIRPVRDYIYQKESSKLIGELTTLALQLNSEDFHVFVRLHAHVSSIQVEVYQGGWEKESDKKVTVLEGHLPGTYKYGKMKPKDIREAMKLLKSLSKLNNTVRKRSYKRKS